MVEAAELVGLIAVAAALAGFAGRVGLSSPLVLTAAGLVLSLVPGVPEFELTEDLILLGILPPLLYATAVRTPLVDLRRNKRAIALLSVGLVLATAFAVAGVARLLLPDLPFGLALALGAVVAPPDAVAATAVARRVGMPRRVVTILEGESLLNDATALVTLRTALAALGGGVTLLEASWDFVVAVVAGAGMGLLFAQVASWVRKHVRDPVLDTSMSLLIPFAAFPAAEGVQGSGVIAVVVAGLILGHRSPEIQSAASRVIERVIWRTVSFLLESVAFLLIGLQLAGLLTGANQSELSNGRIATVCLAVLAAVIVVRMVWVFPAAYLARLLPAVRAAEPVAPSPRDITLVGWAGMRGVVTIAAAFTIPESAPNRDVLLAAAFAVVVGSLLIQGASLPLLVRLLGVSGPDPAQDALQRALVQTKAGKASLERLEEASADRQYSDDLVDGLRAYGKRLKNAAWERLGSSNGRETPSEAFRRLRIAMLAAERDVVVDVRRSGAVPSDVVAGLIERIDQEEAMLELLVGDSVEARPDGRLVPEHTGECEHLEAADDAVTPTSGPEACPDCLAIGEEDWVHLRMCLTCGHIGCCDSSPRRHAFGHYNGTRHPVMRSVELGEYWRWCYVDSLVG